MFAPPHRKKGQPPPTTRVMRHMAQTSLDAFQRRMSKSKPDEATASLKGHSSPSPTQTRRKPNGDGSPSPSPTGSMESDDVAPPPPRDATKAMPKIHTVEEARDCLLAAQLIKPEDPMDPNTLACSLMRISLFPGLSQAVRDATCSVALLLAQLEQSTNMDATAERLAGQMLDKFTETVKAVTQAAVAEVKSASSALTESSTQIAATTVSYRDMLKSTMASPAAGVTTLDARV